MVGLNIINVNAVTSSGGTGSEHHHPHSKEEARALRGEEAEPGRQPMLAGAPRPGSVCPATPGFPEHGQYEPQE